MTTHKIVDKTAKTLKSNSPEILMALGVTGVITTSYLTGKASFTACDIIRANEAATWAFTDRRDRVKDRVKLVWRLYVPAGISGALTIGAVIGSSRTGSRRTAAAVAAYSLTERAFSEYKEKVVEQIGKGQEQKIRDEIVQDRIADKPHTGQEVIMVGTGNVLCCELYTHRYFRSDMETLRKAENTINGEIINTMYVPLEEFYDLIGLPHTSVSDVIGWDSDRLMELRFSTVMSEGGEPCLAFDYSYVKPID